MDPSFKIHEEFSGIDLAQAMGYSQNTFLNSAISGATLTADYIQKVNDTNINSNLSLYSDNLVNTIRSQHANKPIEDIIGGRKIVQSTLNQYQTSLPHLDITGSSQVWNEIPSTYNHTIRVAHAGINHTLDTHDLSGKRLTITYDASGRPQLRLNGTLKATGNTTTAGQSLGMVVDIKHNYASTTNFDRAATYYLKSGGTFSIFYNFGGDSTEIIESHSRQLDEYLEEGLSTTSETVMGETLHIMGMTSANQNRMMNNVLLSAIVDSIAITHHRVGVAGQSDGYYFDIKQNLTSTIARTNSDSDEDAQFFAKSFLNSGFEHSVLEQLMGSTNLALSTVKLFELANDDDLKIFEINAANVDAITPQLQDYNQQINPGVPNSPTLLNKVKADVADGRTVYAPEKGNLTLVGWNWQGGAYISKFNSSNFKDINFATPGGFSGGYPVFNTPLNPTIVNYNTDFSLFNPNRSITTPTFTAQDPVDMTTGDYLYDHTDLTLGGHSGLGFSRAYTSARNRSNRGLGPGWAHNNDIYLSKSSNALLGLGTGQPVDAASSIVAAYIAFDLMRNADILLSWVTNALISSWAMDELLDNAITVNFGHQTLQFIQQANGSYSSPAGSTAKLIKNTNGTFKIEHRFDTVYHFNSKDNIGAIFDSDANTTTYSYDTSDRLKTVSNNFNQSLTLTYTNNNVSAVSDSAGRAIGFTYETDGDLDTYTDPDGKVWQYDYDTDHRMTTITDPVQTVIVTNQYDSHNDVMSQIVPRQGGGTATYQFYFSGYRNIEEDPDGGQTIYFINNKSLTTAVQNALGHTVFTEFDGQKHVTKTIDARNNPTTFIYDNDHNLRFSIDALSKQTENVYDTLHRLTDTIDPLTHTTEFEYDSEHHLSLTRDAIGNAFSSTYFVNGTQKTLKDGRNITTSYTYDTSGNLKTSRLAVTPTINYNYNAIGLLESLTDQAGSTTSFIYNDRSQVEEITDPLNKKTVFTYDDAGRLKTLKDRNLKTTVFDYTPTGKVETIDYANNPDVSFAYSLRDNLDTMTDAIGTTSYGYDAANQLTSMQNPYGFNVGYVYDAAGNLVLLGYPGSKTVSYTYDALNRLKTVKIDWLPGTPTTTYNYDDAGRLDFVTNFNGSITDYTFDDANRLTKLVNKKANNTILSSQEFTSIDGNGNRLQEVREEPITPNLSTPRVTQSYNAQRNRLTATTNDSFNYNNEGEQTVKSGLVHIFDEAHRLKKIGTDTLYSYDGANNRLRVQRGSVVNRYIYDANNNLLAEANNGNQVQRYFIHGLGLLGMVEGNNLYTYHFDATGNTLAMTNASQTIVNSYAYSAYGKIAAENETVPQPFKYVGQYGVYYEADHNLYYMRARYYDPEIGRFISEDPIGMEGGLNLYAYVAGNPVNAIDPSGECPWCIAAGVGGLVGGAIDAGLQLAGNGGDISQVDWGSVGTAALAGAALSGLGPTGALLGRGGTKAIPHGYSKTPGILNRTSTRFGWSGPKNGNDVLSLRVGRQHRDVPGIGVRSGARPVRDGTVSGASGSGFGKGF